MNGDGNRKVTAIGTGAPDHDKIDDLLDEIAKLDLQDIDPEALREAESEQTRMILETLVGKTIVRAELEDMRIVVETTGGNRYFFYGFMGGGTGT
ncbi:MAG: hypothetical protein IAI50_06665 [Candidatus Eremiobacteraeota bacterium]|nr:hypothetical protein [Candidatus Eremiobacteraeota bacterium]